MPRAVILSDEKSRREQRTPQQKGRPGEREGRAGEIKRHREEKEESVRALAARFVWQAFGGHKRIRSATRASEVSRRLDVFVARQKSAQLSSSPFLFNLQAVLINKLIFMNV